MLRSIRPNWTGVLGGQKLRPKRRGSPCIAATLVQGRHVRDVHMIVSPFSEVLKRELEASAAGLSPRTIARSSDWLGAALDAQRPPVPEPPPCLRVLGLTFPCGIDDVRRAFRRLALTTHPDRPGGSQQAFVVATAAYEDSLRLVESKARASRVAETAETRTRPIGRV